jgi:putative SOS response-associated peptidase YedK
MSRLHIFAAAPADVAARFDALPQEAIALPAETSEGSRGLAIYAHRGRRLLKVMHWGFPRLTRENRERGEPPGRVGLVADLTNPFWEQVVINPRYRCLIPITHFANPDRALGASTRTWFSVKDQPIAAWAGFCRNLPDYGAVYAGMTMTANAEVESTNDRMPVLLDPVDYTRWLQGSIQDVIAIQFREPLAAERMVVTRTEDAWRSGKLPPAAQPQFSLF